MKILFIKQLFYPEPTARSLDFALELKKNGHEVQVLTGFPSYPIGKIYKGYKQKFFYREKIEGIDVIRVPIFPDQSGRAIFRILNYLSYAISATIFGLPRVSKPDVVFVYHGALPVGIPAMIYKFFRRVPFVYDINDIWPETLAVSGLLKNKFLLNFVERWCSFTYKRADKITVLSEGFKTLLISKGVPEKKIHIVYHWSRDPISYVELEDKVVKEKFFPKEKINFLFPGNIGIGQSLLSILKVAKSLNVPGSNVNFTFLGEGVSLKELKDFVEKEKLSNVCFHPRVLSSEVSSYLQSADVLIVHLKNTTLFEITIPSKTIAFMKAGKPILAGLKGNGAQLVKSAKAGLVCTPDDVNDIKEKVIQFASMDKEQLSDMGKNGLGFYEKNLSIGKNTKKYISIFEEIKRR